MKIDKKADKSDVETVRRELSEFRANVDERFQEVGGRLTGIERK